MISHNRKFIIILNFVRIKAFEEILDQDVIDMQQLQKLAFNGNHCLLLHVISLLYVPLIIVN